MMNPAASSLIQELKKKHAWSVICSLRADSLAVSLDSEGPIPLCLTVALESVTDREAHRYVN